MIAITAPIFNQEFIGTMAFYFSLISVILVFITTCYRYIKIGVNIPLKPVIGVFAAPFSLCAVGYLASVSPKSLILLLAMFFTTKILYVMVLYKFITYRRLPFFPTYAAYTFPIVINTITTLQTQKYLIMLGYAPWILHYTLSIEIVIAILLVIYVLYFYLIAIFKIP